MLGVLEGTNLELKPLESSPELPDAAVIHANLFRFSSKKVQKDITGEPATLLIADGLIDRLSRLWSGQVWMY